VGGRNFIIYWKLALPGQAIQQKCKSNSFAGLATPCDQKIVIRMISEIIRSAIDTVNADFRRARQAGPACSHHGSGNGG
jgi:hypothetical protein